MADDPKEPYGHVTYADSGYQEDKKKRYPLDSEEHCRAAWSYINMPKNAAKYSSEHLKTIKGKIKAALKKYGAEVSEDDHEYRSEDVEIEEFESPRGPIELRDAGVGGVDFDQRIISVIAAPYESPAKVTYRGEIWSEIFERTAFATAQRSPNRIRVNRGHDRGRTVGKVIRFDPQREDGLVADVRIGKTPLGDETLELASEDMLSASVGFAAAPGDQQLDRRAMTRRIRKAYLDHLSFVEDPAYVDARVLSVRGDDPVLLAAQEPVLTPNLDQFADDEILRWAAQRLNQIADAL